VSSWQQHSLIGSAGSKHPCALFVPRVEPNANITRLPLLLFLHGIGERGDDGIRPTRVGIGPAIQAHPEWFGCLVAFPQCPAHERWTENLHVIDIAWRFIARKWPVDPRRVLVTGVSMGGFGAWAYGARRGGELAALIPVCGGGRTDRIAGLTRVPIWAFHGSRDTVILPSQSRRMVAAVREAGGQARYTEYAEQGHDCWDRVYQDPTVIQWMLAQQRQGS
jgi:predicted peptidase